LKITHLTHSDYFGGATNFALRIIDAGNSIGLKNILIVSSKKNTLSETYIVSPTGNNKINYLKAKATQKIDRYIRRIEKTETPMDKSPNLIGCINSKTINKSDSDVIHFHFVNGGLISIKQIGKITKPVLWTMPDMWTFLGGEHYLTPSDYERFLNGYLKSNRNVNDLGIDIGRIIWRQKLECFKKLNVIAPSKWLAEQASKSPLFINKEIEVIPPPIDLEFFKPKNLIESRQKFFLKRNDFVIGFLGGTQLRKGWEFIEELIDHSKSEASWRFVLGGTGRSKYPKFNDRVLLLGTIIESSVLQNFYSALDVLLVPSIQEAYGLVAQEAQACGIPVVVFSDTGCSDIVNNGVTGYRVKNRSTSELVKVLRLIQSLDRSTLEVMKYESRRRAENLWEMKFIAKKYEKKYQHIIANSKTSSLA